jgi:hypothetical protein
MKFLKAMRKTLPVVTIVVVIFYIVSLLYYTEGFNGVIPGFSTEGYPGGGLNTKPLFSGSMVMGVGVFAGILFMMTMVTIFAF